MKNKKTPLISLFVLLTIDSIAGHLYQADIVVYGGTSGAVTAAVEASKMGKKVILVSPDKNLGGLSSSGLGFTDLGNPKTLGGLGKDFYHRIYLHYQNPSAWMKGGRLEDNKGQHGLAIDEENKVMNLFEPHVAEGVFNQWISENNIQVIYERLDLKNGVKKQGSRIVEFKTEEGNKFAGKVFIDATYEGDLMAKAGVRYTIGRESSEQYGESANGQQIKKARLNQLPKGIDPYVIKGNPASGLLPGVNPFPSTPDGSGDTKIQAYCYRLTLTDMEGNKVAITKPDGYKESDFELLFRAIEQNQKAPYFKFSMLPNRKTDSNNSGGLSMDYIGANYAYPEGTHKEREKIAKAHEYWQRGIIWTLQNSPRVPQNIKNRYLNWGLPADEFKDNNNWPYELYVREARRMIGESVATQKILVTAAPVPKPIGMGSYAMDSHHVQRIVGEDGFVMNEGDIQQELTKPYSIDYGVIVPQRSDCTNLLVPVCLSASHIAYGSIRMEPVFMILGQSAAAAAVIAVNDNVDVQDVSYTKLKDILLAAGQVLTLE